MKETGISFLTISAVSLSLIVLFILLGANIECLSIIDYIIIVGLIVLLILGIIYKTKNKTKMEVSTCGLTLIIIGGIFFILDLFIQCSYVLHYSHITGISTLETMPISGISIFILSASLILIVVGIIFCVKKHKKEITKINNIETTKINEENELENLKKQAMELQILKEHGLIKDNKVKYCQYCGSLIINHKCSNCGAKEKE